MLITRNKNAVAPMNTVLNGHFIDVRQLYVYTWKAIPCVAYIGEIDTSKVFFRIREVYRVQIQEIFQHTYYDYAKAELLFNTSIVTFYDQRIIEIGNNYCEILYTSKQMDWLRALVNMLVAYRLPVKDPPKRVIGFARKYDTI